MTALLSIFLFLIVMSAVVAVHEWGHLVFARIERVAVATYAVGFGPTLWWTRSEKTGTEYKINLIPLGGFCRFATLEEMKDTECPVAGIFLEEAPPIARLIIALAGPLLNFVLALPLVIASIVIEGYPIAMIPHLCAKTYSYLFTDNVSGTFYALLHPEQIFSQGSGIIGIGATVIQSQQQGATSYLLIIAQLSIGLGAVNLVPLSILDGGQALFAIYELIFRRTANDAFKSASVVVSLVLVAALVLVTNGHDIARLIHPH